MNADATVLQAPAAPLTLYLSRLLLNARSRAVHRDLGNPYELHRTLLRAFPDGVGHRPRGVEGGAGLLYRMEPENASGWDAAPLLLVQSWLPPDWAALPAGWLLAGAGENPAVKPFAPSFAAGQALAFRLRANPTRRLGKSAGERQGQRVGVRPAELEGWLARKLEAAGARLLTVNVANEGHALGRLPGAEGERTTARWLGVRFDGRLLLRDPALLAQAVASGIGSGKAFGFGLLSLARGEG